VRQQRPYSVWPSLGRQYHTDSYTPHRPHQRLSCCLHRTRLARHSLDHALWLSFRRQSRYSSVFSNSDAYSCHRCRPKTIQRWCQQVDWLTGFWNPRLSLESSWPCTYQHHWSILTSTCHWFPSWTLIGLLASMWIRGQRRKSCFHQMDWALPFSYWPILCQHQ